MTLDNEQQRTILLQLIDAANVPGKAIEQVMAIKVAISIAQITEKPNIKAVAQ